MPASLAPPSPSLRPPPALPCEPVWPLTVHQYHEMIRTGILTDDDPVELLEGVLVPKMSKNPPHSAATRRLREALRPLLPPGWLVDSQEPVTLGDGEPEPDVVVMRGVLDQYDARHPGPADVGMLVEVTDATLARDRGVKKRTYARGRISVYWIVNLVEGQVEVYTEPSGPTDTPDFGRRQDYRRGETVPVVLDGVEVGRVAVDDFLP